MRIFIICNSSSNIIWVLKSKRTSWADHAVVTAEIGNEYNILVVKPEGMRPHGKPRCRGGNIKLNLDERGCEGVKCIHIAQGRN
jgi:hypothetical protein